MGIEFKRNLIVCKEVVSVEDAEPLLEWLQKKTAAKIDLSACTHLHAANLQVLMAAKANIVSWPADTDFRVWLMSALNKS